LGIEAWNAYYA
jgi:hypothetical protein